MSACSCWSNTNLSSCSSNANNGGACGGHVNSCPSHGGYIAPVTYTFTNVTVSAGETIGLQNEITELKARLNSEAVRRGLSQTSVALNNPIHAVGEIRTLRDHHNTVCAKTSVSPYSNTQIVNTQVILANTIETMKDNVVARGAQCACQCNYSCTCQCNYCTCQCNYCTCVCNHVCKCQCNY